MNGELGELKMNSVIRWPLAVLLVLLGGVVAVVGNVWFLVVAFQEDFLNGLLLKRLGAARGKSHPDAAWGMLHNS